MRWRCDSHEAQKRQGIEESEAYRESQEASLVLVILNKKL